MVSAHFEPGTLPTFCSPTVLASMCWVVSPAPSFLPSLGSQVSGLRQEVNRWLQELLTLRASCALLSPQQQMRMSFYKALTAFRAPCVSKLLRALSHFIVATVWRSKCYHRSCLGLDESKLRCQLSSLGRAQVVPGSACAGNGWWFGCYSCRLE